MSEWFMGKFYAVRALTEMVLWFDNWREVFDGYRGRAHLPPLRFRRGFVLQHGSLDEPIQTFWEVFRDRSYRRHIEESRAGVMIDLGANIGLVTLDWATRLKAITIHAYEPHPATFATLAANIAANHLSGSVRVYNEAVSGHPGALVLQTHESSVLASAYGKAKSDGSSNIRVPAISLDQVVARCVGQGPINLVKMDVEGAEADILEGAAPQTLEKVRQFVLEYHDNLCPRARLRCEQVLEKAGFHCRVRSFDEQQGLLYARRD